MSSQETQKPRKVFRSRTIQASVWRSDSVKDGETSIQHSVKIQKQYKKKDGSYQETNYYFPEDLPRLVLVCQKAFEFISLVESKDAHDSVPI